MSVTQWPIEDLEISSLRANEENPQEMTDEQFSKLVDEIAENGWMSPIQVAGPVEDGKYEIIGGHHRIKAAEVLGIESVPAVIVDPDHFDKDTRDIEMVRQNVLQGQLNPSKFTDLYNRLAQKYDADVLRQMMAFTKQDAFEKVYLDAKQALPSDMQEELEKSKDEIQTVDDLSLVLNSLFNKYGDTLTSNFMVFTHGGKESIMVRLSSPGYWQRIKEFSEWCFEQNVAIDEELMLRMNWPVSTDSPLSDPVEVDKEEIGKTADERQAVGGHSTIIEGPEQEGVEEETDGPDEHQSGVDEQVGANGGGGSHSSSD